MKNLFLLFQLYYFSLGKETVPKLKNAGLKLTEVSQEDVTLNFTGLKNVKSLNSENPRSWDFFLFSLPETGTPFGAIELLF